MREATELEATWGEKRRPLGDAAARDRGRGLFQPRTGQPEPLGRARPHPRTRRRRPRRAPERSARRRPTEPATVTRRKRGGTSRRTFRAHCRARGRQPRTALRPGPGPGRGRGVPDRRAPGPCVRPRAGDGPLHGSRRLHREGRRRRGRGVGNARHGASRGLGGFLDRFAGEEIDTAGDGSSRCSTARPARFAASRDPRGASPARPRGACRRAHGEVERPSDDKPRGIAVHVKRASCRSRARARCS